MSDYPTRKVLHFLVDVLDEAERASNDGLNVIPVVVKDDLPRLLPVIAEVCRFAGHPFALAEKAADGIELVGHAGEVNETLKKKVEDLAIDPTSSGTTIHLAVSTDKGELTVRIGRNPAPTNPGDRNQLGLLTALLDPGMRLHRVAVLAYDETSMSKDNQERMWTFLLQELQSLGGNCRALLVFVGCAELDHARHFREIAGTRWAFEDGNVRWRQRWSKDRTHIARIAARDQPLVLMLGAGVAMSSGLPLGNELRDEALSRLVPDLANRGADYRTQAAELFQQVASTNRLMATEACLTEDEFIEALTLERVLREEARDCVPGETLPTLREFDERQKERLDDAGGAIRDLRELLRLRRRLVLLTVNFDQLLEHGAKRLEPTEEDPYDTTIPSPTDPPAVRMFITSEDFKKFPHYYAKYLEAGGAVPYIKLHGTIDRPETVRANVDETLPGLTWDAGTMLRALVAATDASVDWVYVGCSMRDPDVDAITRTQEFAHRAREVWVSPLVDPHVERWISQIRQPAWQAKSLPESLRERTITQTADVFFKHLRSFLEGNTS